MPSPRSTNRIVFLDWLRGLAAVTMLQGHTFDAFLRPESRNGSAFIFSQYFGGEAPAVFLFLTGVTYGLGMNKAENLPPWTRVLTALKRARYLLLLAFLFRLQTWSFSWPMSSSKDLLKVDILNAMGATAGLLGIIALVRGMQRVRWAMLAGIALAALAPLISMLDTGGVPAPLRAYFVPSGEFFSIFPWGSFVAFGVAVGSAIPLIKREDWNRVMQWSALAGFAMLLAGQYFSNLPYSLYTKSDFWLNSPALISCKVGITLLLASFAFLWTGYLSPGWSWVRQLGTTSLPVYWVHIELVYGRWFADYRAHLEVWQCVTIAVVLTVAMLGLSVLVTKAPWKQFLPVNKKKPEPIYSYENLAEERVTQRR